MSEELFGYYQTSCTPIAKPVLSQAGNVDIPIAKLNYLLFFGDRLTITEELYTESEQCTGRSSPSRYKTTVEFKELSASDVTAPYHELSVSDFSVELYAGPLSGSLNESHYCDRNDWLDGLPINITQCLREQDKGNSREFKRWIVFRSGDVLKLGFLNAKSAFDPAKIEWMDPGEFSKIQQ